MVYKPREDSYLLKDHLEEKDLEGKKCFDMGAGSGILALKMAEKGAYVTAVDIDLEAINYSNERAEEEGLKDRIKFFDSNLFENISQSQEFDLIVFNPPYLPGEKGIKNDKSWSGGKKGVEVTEQFLDQVEGYLSDTGEALVILSSHSEIQDLIDQFELKIIEEQKTWFEQLFLAKLG